MTQPQQSPSLSFWDHLDVLRGELLRMIAAAMLMAVAAFVMKDWLFDVVLAPSRGDFFIYRWIGGGDFHLHLINTGLTEQMMIHLKVSLVAGLMVASPYILYVAFRFVSPALYDGERYITRRLLTASYGMFLFGMLLAYMLLFPLTVRFLGTYQVSSEVDNMLSITSYVDTLLMMLLIFGLICQLPVMAWLLARWGMLRPEWMQRYRRHAIVVILIVVAIITPTADILSLIIVSLPVWLLYEISILLARVAYRQKQ